MDSITTIILVLLTIVTEKFLEDFARESRQTGNWLKALAATVIVVFVLFVLILIASLLAREWLIIPPSPVWKMLEQSGHLISMFDGWYGPRTWFLLVLVQLGGLGLGIWTGSVIKWLKNLNTEWKSLVAGLLLTLISGLYNIFFFVLVKDPDILVTAGYTVQHIGADGFNQIIAFLTRFTLVGLFLFLTWMSLCLIMLDNSLGGE